MHKWSTMLKYIFKCSLGPLWTMTGPEVRLRAVPWSETKWYPGLQSEWLTSWVFTLPILMVLAIVSEPKRQNQRERERKQVAASVASRAPPAHGSQRLDNPLGEVSTDGFWLTQFPSPCCASSTYAPLYRVFSTYFLSLH